MVGLQELVYTKVVNNSYSVSNVLGYRLYVEDKEFDFSTDLLEYVYLNYIKYGVSIKVKTTPIELILNNNCQYVSSSDNAIELSNEDEVDSLLGKYIPKCNSSVEHIENLLYYRYLVCRYMLLSCEIPLGKIEKVSINTKLSSTWGRCCRRRLKDKYSSLEYSYVIEISEALLVGTTDYEGIDNTIIHELIHTCYGCFNHGSLWKGIAQKICWELGFDIKRLSSSEEKGLDIDSLINLGYYICQCEDCGNIIHHKTKCQFIQHPEWYTCSCGGKFKKVNY